MNVKSPISVPILINAIENEKRLEKESINNGSQLVHSYTVVILERLLDKVLDKANIEIPKDK